MHQDFTDSIEFIKLPIFCIQNLAAIRSPEVCKIERAEVLFLGAAEIPSHSS